MTWLLRAALLCWLVSLLVGIYGLTGCMSLQQRLDQPVSVHVIQRPTILKIGQCYADFAEHANIGAWYQPAYASLGYDIICVSRGNIDADLAHELNHQNEAVSGLPLSDQFTPP